MMKRMVVSLSAAVLLALTLVPAAHAAPSPEGALRAAFNSALSGGNGNAYATLAHDGQGMSFAANNSIFDYRGDTVEAGARRIVPGSFDQEYCSSNVFGVWWFLFAPPEYKALVEGVTVEITIDGEPLSVEYSATKKSVDPAGFFGGTGWWKSAGVPVLGHLDPGTYHVASVVTWPGFDPWPAEAMVTITDC